MFIVAETSKQHIQKRQEEKGDVGNPLLAQEQAQKVSPEAEKFLRMLQVHNNRAKKSRGEYIQYCGLRERAAREGLNFEELKEQAAKENEALEAQ